MRLSEWQSRRSTIGLTPLIDVVFLLLIFFMLASTFLKFSALPVSGARGGDASSSLSQIAIIQVRGVDEIRVNGVSIGLQGLLPQIEDLVAKGVSRAVVQPTEGASVQDLVAVLEVAKKSTLKSVVLVR